MCTICQALRPSSDNYEFHTDPVDFELSMAKSAQPVVETPEDADLDDAEVSPVASDLPTYSLDQIAEQLTEDYWQSTGRGERSFDLDADRTLTVDISGLTTAGQNLATEALEAWSGVTNINFEFFTAPPSSVTGSTVFEVGDAAADTTTSASISVGDTFNGSLGTNGDRDWVAVTLTEGETYRITLAGDGSLGDLRDPYLRLYNSQGFQVAFNDDANGLDSALNYSASTSGTYYMAAGAYSDSYTGGYALRIQEGAGSSVDIVFDDEDSGAYSTSSTSGGTILSSFVNVATEWLSSNGTSLTSYSYQTYLHEIGHALGLGHAGNYNGSARFDNDASYANESWQTSVMSYFAQDENPNVDASLARVSTPQIADIVAIQNLYGSTPATRAGDSTYGDGATSDHNIDLLTGNSNTIYDGGGIDTIDLGSRSDWQTIDLNPEAFSDINGEVGNLIIARGTVIENVITGSGRDRIVGNDADNRLEGGAGNDSISGGAGDDMLIGGDGGDNLTGGAGDDMLLGGGGFDWITPGSGDDYIDGGAANDMVSFVDYAYAIQLNMTTGQVISVGEVDTLVNVENVTGSIFGDFIQGNDDNNRIRGLGDYDWLVGSGGEDQYEGGNGRDMVSYVFSSTGVVVSLDAMLGYAGQALGDTYDSVERVTGSSFSDTFYGGDGADDFRGLGGNDVFFGSGGGKDRYYGGSGTDTVSYGLSAEGVRASLSLGRGSTGDAARDLYFDIENLTGTRFSDDLAGNSGRNTLFGGAGDDFLFGYSGNDALNGGAGSDFLDGGAGYDTAYLSGNAADYTIIEEENRVRLLGAGTEEDILVSIERIIFEDETLIL